MFPIRINEITYLIAMKRTGGGVGVYRINFFSFNTSSLKIIKPKIIKIKCGDWDVTKTCDFDDKHRNLPKNKSDAISCMLYHLYGKSLLQLIFSDLHTKNDPKIK